MTHGLVQHLTYTIAVPSRAVGDSTINIVLGINIIIIIFLAIIPPQIWERLVYRIVLDSAVGECRNRDLSIKCLTLCYYRLPSHWLINYQLVVIIIVICRFQVTSEQYRRGMKDMAYV